MGMKRAHETALTSIGIADRGRFNRLSKQFTSILNKIKYYDTDYVLPFWKDINSNLGKLFVPGLPYNFLDNPTLCNTMSSTNEPWATSQLNFIKNHYNKEELTYLLRETIVGDPFILDEEYLASCNSIHHLYHFEKFKQHTKLDLNSIESIFEIGGGYGRLPLLFYKLLPNLKSYTIVDLSVFTVIQYIYLSSVLGEDSVNLMTEKHRDIDHNKINLIPIGLFYETVLNSKFDMFTSMWSLSECNKNLIEAIANRDFMGAKHIYMGLHGNSSSQLPFGQFLYSKLAEHKIDLLSVGFVQNHYYAFK